MVLTKLALSNFTVHKVRLALTVAAIALSVSLVVAVTSGYSSAEGAAYDFLAQFIGTTDASITRRGEGAGMDESLRRALGRDPDVRHVDGQLEINLPLLDRDGQPVPGLPAQIRGVRRPDDKRVEQLQLREGAWFEAPEGNVAVIDQVAKEKLQVELGQTFWLPGPSGKLPLKVVGVIHKPGIFAAQVQSVYVPLETLQRFALPEQPQQVNGMFIDLRPGADDRAFAARWEPRLAQIDPALKLRLASESRKEMDRNLEGVHVMSYLGGAVSMLAATFIVFSALAMGVTERQRMLAMMRAVGALPRQLAALVLLEGALLAGAGVLIGVPLGVVFIHILGIRFANIFTAGIVLSWGGIAFAAAGSIAAALLASALPAWTATRVDPLEAMSPLARPSPSRVPWKPALAGLLLVLVDPFLLWGGVHRTAALLGVEDVEAAAKPIAFFGHFVIGLPTLMLGFFLLAPLVVWLTERLIGPVVAALLGLRFSMLRQQLSGGIWRAAGTSAALMVGLSILVVMNTQGRSAIEGWHLPDRFPDVFITGLRPGGFKLDDQEQLAQVEGIEEVMPILYNPASLIASFFSFKGAEVVPDATLFIGIDPDKAFRMMELMFLDERGRAVSPQERERLAAQAVEMLRKGRHIVVTEEFRALRGLYTGDRIALVTPKHGQVDYTIAGVVWSPGIDVFVSFFDLGQQIEQRTAASVFGSLEDARRDFDLSGAYLFAANLEPGLEKEELVKRISTTLAGWGFAAYDVRQIKYDIQLGFQRMLLLVSTIAFAAMAVASLGVTNTVMASVRTRRWQFGILRSVGLTRSGLLRLVLAEALLLGIVGCALGLAAGFEMTVNAKQLWGMVIGYRPPTRIPWEMVTIGVTVIMSISLVASLFPAVTVARSEPLELLQAGRVAG